MHFLFIFLIIFFEHFLFDFYFELCFFENRFHGDFLLEWKLIIDVVGQIFEMCVRLILVFLFT